MLVVAVAVLVVGGLFVLYRVLRGDAGEWVWRLHDRLSVTAVGVLALMNLACITRTPEGVYTCDVEYCMDNALYSMVLFFVLLMPVLTQLFTKIIARATGDKDRQ